MDLIVVVTSDYGGVSRLTRSLNGIEPAELIVGVAPHPVLRISDGAGANDRTVRLSWHVKTRQGVSYGWPTARLGTGFGEPTLRSIDCSNLGDVPPFVAI